MEVPEHVALKLEQLEGGEAGEGVGVYEADEVVVQVEADQTHQTLEQIGVHRRQLVVTHLQDLGREHLFGVGTLALTSIPNPKQIDSNTTLFNLRFLVH